MRILFCNSEKEESCTPWCEQALNVFVTNPMYFQATPMGTGVVFYTGDCATFRGGLYGREAGCVEWFLGLGVLMFSILHRVMFSKL